MDVPLRARGATGNNSAVQNVREEFADRQDPSSDGRLRQAPPDRREYRQSKRAKTAGHMWLRLDSDNTGIVSGAKKNKAKGGIWNGNDESY